MRNLILVGTHAAVLGLGFALGVYLLPILTAPDAPDREVLAASAEAALFKGEFTRDLNGSDFLHWGEGAVSVSASQIVHEGRLAPGPDYRLYLTGEFVEDEAGFNAVKSSAVQVGNVATFDGFILDVPAGIDVGAYTTVVIWCEAFGEFITAAQYR